MNDMNEKQNSMERAYLMINEMSLDSQHYLSFKEDSEFFFSKDIKGMISYEIVGKSAMSIGDPICKLENLEAFTNEYLQHCKQININPIFNSISENMMSVLKKHQFSILQYGQEAVLGLNDFSLAGGKKASLRRNFNSIEKSHVIVNEYKPLKVRDYALENDIYRLSQQWYDDKNYSMNYTIGKLDFETPYDRRFFYSTNSEGELITFCSFLPYNNKKGYCIDIMQRKIGGKTGILEHAIVSVAQQMKTEGIDELSLGIAPLSGIDVDRPDIKKEEIIMDDIFHNMDFDYNFKNLYRYKKKFAPDYWKARYLVYHKDISHMNLLMSIFNTKCDKIDVKMLVRYKLFLMSRKFKRMKKRK